jgi:dTDP-glucose 4,6-dehydratase
MKILVTGGAGFIGSNFIRWALAEHPDVTLLNYDALTYAGNLENLEGLADAGRARFVKGDICDAAAVAEAAGPGFDALINFAAESHVDRALYAPGEFVRTNVHGTYTLLEAARHHRIARFVQVSTDEVYGSMEPGRRASEEAPLRASSPYSASKAGADQLALAYQTTFGLDVVVTRSSNNYGPYQHPEKLIPLFVTRAIQGQSCPLYGDGRHERDWLFVEDHCRGLWAALTRGRPGRIYNFGTGVETPNIEIARRIMKILGRPESLIVPTGDRPGHDRRYALDVTRARAELGWRPSVALEDGLARTVEWYRRNADWISRVKSGEYQHYYDMHYSRLTHGA